MNFAPTETHRPLPRALLVLVLVIAAIECLLSAADAGFIFDPTLRLRFL